MDLVATHQRLLVGAALRTKGPILELGCGFYSTPLLHEIAEVQDRLLITIDNNIDWLAQFLSLESKCHKLKLVGWWGELYEHSEALDFSLCFVDQGQPCEREYAIRKLMDKVRVFVMHDTEEQHAYGYGRTLPMFRYQFTDRCQKAWTTIVSNSVDVTGWFKELPPCEPSVEVT